MSYKVKDFKTLGMEINPQYLCTDNVYNYDLCRYTTESHRIVDVMCNLCGDRFFISKVSNIQHPNMIIEVFKKSIIKELGSLGLTIPEYYDRSHFAFLSSWFLLSSLCWVIEPKENVNEDDITDTGYISYLATKNIRVLDTMNRIGLISKEELRQAVPCYKDVCKTTQEELNTSTLRVIAFDDSANNGEVGYSVKTVSPNNGNTFIVPYFAIRLISKYIVDLLSYNRVRVSYRHCNNICNVFTMLKKPKLYDKPEKIAYVNKCDLCVYDYCSGADRKINLLDIMGISLV